MHSQSIFAMKIFSLVPTKLRRRLCGSVRTRQLIAVCSLTAVVFLLLHQGPLFSSVDEKPQMNDRKILESDNVVVVPQVVDADNGDVKRLKHPKNGVRFTKQQSELSSGSNTVTDDQPVTVVLVICAIRPAAIKNHLQQLIRLFLNYFLERISCSCLLRPSSKAFPIVVSQDGTLSSVTNVIKEFVNETEHIHFIQNIADCSSFVTVLLYQIKLFYCLSNDINQLSVKCGSYVLFFQHTERKAQNNEAAKKAKNYFFIAQHYKWALDKIFFEMNYDTAIITEDDLDIAEDFFSYFSATRYLLRSDPTIWCISAWNDNGGNNITDRSRSDILYRTDFFPGLGWELTVDLWRELSAKWPLTYWDDWLRRQDVRQGRVCIRPESGMARTAYYGIVSFMLGSSRVYAISAHVYADPNFLSRPSSDFYTEDWDKMSRYLDFQETYCKPGKFTGDCDPNNPKLKEWFAKKRLTKRLQSWGEMIVN
ncbi:unnamed protein product [Anisakis simplex]|uniref:Alpha-1,3-mannosyl-glycoprotein 2-beta-N-acetylglucosaminyltransferase n=1 Tax=Anisakis simplex TaxID=6269 RepID=A0A3P6QLE0_ANISI|nr:unnamed protein product [Anisakis simplex]